MNVHEASHRLECSESTIYALVAAGKLHCHRIGVGRGAIRITEEHVVEFLAKVAPAAVRNTPGLPLRHIRLN